MKTEEQLGFPKKSELLHTAEAIDSAISRIARAINYSPISKTTPLVICVLNGGLLFTGHLLPRLSFPLELGYIHTSKYSGSSEVLTDFQVKSDFPDVEERTVLFLDDVLDSGETLKFLEEHATICGATQVKTAVLVHKTDSAWRSHFIGLPAPNKFLFGFGMDYRGLWRNLPAIYAIKE